MPIKKFRDVNLKRPQHIVPRLQSYGLQAPRLNYFERANVIVEHRCRPIVRHMLDEVCEVCALVNEVGRTRQK